MTMVRGGFNDLTSPAMKHRKKKQTKGSAKIEKVMHEFKTGRLKSSSGQMVRNPKQAIAIALSEAKRRGYQVG